MLLEVGKIELEFKIGGSWRRTGSLKESIYIWQGCWGKSRGPMLCGLLIGDRWQEREAPLESGVVGRKMATTDPFSKSQPI